MTTQTRITISIPAARIADFNAATEVDTPQPCWTDAEGNHFAAMSFMAAGDFALPGALAVGAVGYSEGEELALVPGQIHLISNWDGALAIQQTGLSPRLPDC